MSRIILGLVLLVAGLGLMVGWLIFYLKDTRLGLPKHVNRQDWERVTHISARGFQKRKGRVS